MKLGETLRAERVLLGGEASDLTEATALLLAETSLLAGAETPSVEDAARRMVAGESGTVVRVSEHVMTAAVGASGAGELAAALGVFPGGFMALTPRDGEPSPARVLLLIATPGRVAVLRAEAFPRLARALRSGSTVTQLLRAATPADVLGISELMDVQLHGQLRVQDAMNPVSLRIYPDTPIAEIVDLMVRRGVRALPVVGTEYEVLGIITSSDVLKHMVPKWLGGDDDREPDEPEVLARDVMSRSVMCVAEDQTLLDAARVMANKGFEYLPVVREGELVGFVTEEAVLRMLSAT